MNAMLAIQIVISLVQVINAIASSVMTCKAITRDSGVVNYNGGVTAMTNIVTSQPTVLPQQ